MQVTAECAKIAQTEFLKGYCKTCNNSTLMNIWLDDQREAPEGWVHLHNMDEVEVFLESILYPSTCHTGRRAGSGYNTRIEKMSFDYHLSHPKKGIDVMKYLADLCVKESTNRFWPKEIFYHSNDPEGVKEMKAFAERFEEDFLM